MTAWWTFMFLLGTAHKMHRELGYSMESCVEAIDRLITSCSVDRIDMRPNVRNGYANWRTAHSAALG